MAKLTKRLCLPVGSFLKEGAEKPTTEYRDIGVVIEFEDREGNKWNEVKLNLDILHPSLFHLAKSQMEKGSSAARVKLFDVTRRTRDAAEPEAPGAPADDEPW